jgi:protein O-GlcNAc transferase
MAPSIDEFFGRAMESFRTGNLGDAAQNFKEVLRQDPRHPAALNLLGIVLTHVRKYEEAEPYFKTALQVNPKSDATLYNYGIVLKALNRPHEALERFSEALAINSTIAATWNNRGTVLNDVKKYEEAIRDFDRSILLDGTQADAYCNKGKSLFKLNRHQEALAAYERAVLLKPDLAEAWLGRGHVFGEIKRFDEAFEAYDEALALKPQLAEIWISRAKLLFDLGRYDDALVSCGRALALEPGLAVAWLGRGNIYLELNRHEEAFEAFNRALALDPKLAEAWLGHANLLSERNRDGEALDAYDRALALEPNLAAAWVGRGNTLFRVRHPEDALAAYNKALALEPNSSEAWLGAGNVLFEFKRHDGAASAYEKALELKPTLAEAWLGRGNVFFSLKRYEDAVAAYDRVIALKPNLTGVEGMRLHAKAQLCDWSNFDVECARLISGVMTERPNTGPFQFLTVSSSPEDQLRCATSWVNKHFQPSKKPLWQGERYDHNRIRVAYLSADFRQHPVATLLAGVIQCHDKSFFDITALSCGTEDGSEIRRRIQASFDRFVDVQTHGNDQIANLIKELEIDILVDLMGYTTDSRTGILARRAAPVQVNYLGYPGTMGADYIDYLIADRIVVPPSHQPFYTEKLVYLPDCYQANDEKRPISQKSMTRAEFGLPESAIIFCCFNNNYKITPTTFDSWMRILGKVENSILWLLEDNESVVVNLKREAETRGINPERIVFAQRMPLPEHLARHRLADLFLDTLPYNAHTTASDALWAGLPLLTRMGDTFAGRVAASILTAVGLPELIVDTHHAYEDLAIHIATHPAKLREIKNKLAENRLTKPLFDTQHYTRNIESAFTEMYRRYQAGLAPEQIDVARQ